jgi:regulator of nonsense transcripts 2
MTDITIQSSILVTKTAEEKEKLKELRNLNISLSKNRPDEDFFPSLDSNLKKITAFIKKLKTVTDDQKNSLLMFVVS